MALPRSAAVIGHRIDIAVYLPVRTGRREHVLASPAVETFPVRIPVYVS